LFPDLIKLYEISQSNFHSFYWVAGDVDTHEQLENNSLRQVYGGLFDLMVSLGYEERYDRWQVAKLVEKGIITPEESAYVDKKYETKGVTP
jgi:hypothetical protein